MGNDNIYKCLECGFIFCEDNATECNDCGGENITTNIADDEYNDFLEDLNKRDIREIDET
jgi:hypothetical protein